MIIRKKRGFTLIELIIVMTIIGILATVSLVGYSSAKMKSRDAKRKADISSISGALAMYYSDHKSYPCSNASTVSGCGGSSTRTWAISYNSADWTKLSSVSFLGPYLPTLPVDPKNVAGSHPTTPYYDTNAFSYFYLSVDGTVYDLATILENTSDSDRCKNRGWKYHNASEALWCGGAYGASPDNLFADH